MDEGRPFRVSQPRDRQVANRPSRVSQQPEAAPKKVQEPPASSPPKPAAKVSRKQPSRRIVITVLAVVIACVAGWLVWSSARIGGAGIDTSRYQAVFFSNGNVYFGKLQSHNEEYYKLSQVYYPQAQTDGVGEASDDQTSTTDQGNITLLKLGAAVYDPEDEMMIAKDQVLFYQNLKSDSRVTQLIDSQADD